MATRRAAKRKMRKTRRRHSGGAGNAFTRLFVDREENHIRRKAEAAAARRNANNAARLRAVNAVEKGFTHEQKRLGLTPYKRKLLDKYRYTFEYLESMEEEVAQDLFEFCDGAKDTFKIDPMLFKDKNEYDLINLIFKKIDFTPNPRDNIIETYKNIKNLVDNKIWSISNGKLVVPKPQGPKPRK
jgi:hypothetical protein